jgi:hypothetical protein
MQIMPDEIIRAVSEKVAGIERAVSLQEDACDNVASGV